MRFLTYGFCCAKVYNTNNDKAATLHTRLNTAGIGACFKSNMQEFYKLEAFSVQQMNMFLKINVLSNLVKCAFPFSAPDFDLTEFPVVNCAFTIDPFPATLRSSPAITTINTRQSSLFAVSE
ncbi:hypothetical protein Tsp_08704 [Trichinella spiralis]|uniref:hypothetical protein n=1 Tax=Trichinella spiralis TaxID=6334 RepID=UPI0001EFE120|nr:hypothetical protein Tsp_08704 [Trichinella spiralis]